MKRLLITILAFIGLSLILSAGMPDEVIVRGKVMRSDDERPVESANVMLCRKDGRAVFSYTMTDAEGAYLLRYSGSADSIAVKVSGINIAQQIRIIPARSTTLDFSIDQASLKIDEMEVTAEPVIRRKDTVIYNVESFKELSDRTIGDVLKKMPGIEVSQSGRISYNGKDVGKLYIEGMDMLEHRYGLITNSVKADDIASVEVMENHRPVKMDAELGLPGSPAINLKLKESAKGTWGGYLMAGGGYKPWLWYGEAAAMFFGRGFQTMNTYKTNNTGDDVSEEIFSFALPSASDLAASVLKVQRPNVPPFGKNRYLDNQVHMLSTNALVKLDKDLNLRANIQYQNDFHRDVGTSLTTYHLAGEEPPLVIDETIAASSRVNRLTADMDIENNASDGYLKDKVSFSGTWTQDFGRVSTNGSEVVQTFGHPDISVSNSLRYIKRKGIFSWNVSSVVSYDHKLESLKVTPLIYREIFGADSGATGAVQSLFAQKFKAHNSGGFFVMVKNWYIALDMKADADIDLMESQLCSSRASAAPSAPDSLRNDIFRQEYTLAAVPSVSYNIPDKFYISLHADIGYRGIRTEDRIRGTVDSADPLIINPSLSVGGNITRELKASAYALYDEGYGGLYSDYSGYIMSNYRYISRTGGGIPHRQTHNFGAELAYAATHIATFANLRGQYWDSRSDIAYSAVYDGTLTRMEAVEAPGRSSGLNLSAEASKLFFSINTTLRLAAGWSRTWSDLYRQNELYHSTYDNLSAKLGFTTRICDWCNLQYDFSGIRSSSLTDLSGGQPPIHSIRQSASLHFIIHRDIFLQVGGEHYYNDALHAGDCLELFLDASASYRMKRLELILECRNLLNTATYTSAVYSDITTFLYSYTLRPACVILKVRIDL